MIKEFLAILLKHPENLNKVIVDGIKPSIFPRDCENEKQLFNIIVTFYTRYKLILDREHLSSTLSTSSQTEEQKKKILFLFEEVREIKTTNTYEYLIDIIKSTRSATILKDTIVNASEFLQRNDLEKTASTLQQGVLSAELLKVKEIEEGTLADSVLARVERYKEAKVRKGYAGIPTGFVSLDNATSGMQPGELIVVMAGTREGKSIFLLNVGHYVAELLSKNVLFISLENPKIQLERRFDSLDSGLSYDKIKNGTLSPEEEAIYKKSLEKQRTSGKNFYTYDMPANCTASVILAKVRELEPITKFDLIVVDYLGIMRAERRTNNGWEEQGATAQELRSVARQLKVPILTAAQVGRESSKSKAKPYYSLEDIALSYLITNHADTVISLRINDIELLQISDAAELTAVLLKNRDGRSAKFTIDARFGVMKMRERGMIFIGKHP